MAEDGEVKEKPSGKEDRGSILYWKAWLKASDKHSKNSIDATTEAYEEYMTKYQTVAGASSVDKSTSSEAKFPIFWSSVRSIQPALYSRTPILVSQPMLDTDQDSFADLCCESVDRLGKYLIHRSPFDRVQYSTRDDFIMGGKATNRVCYYADISTEEKQVRVFPQFSAPEPIVQQAPASGPPGTPENEAPPPSQGANNSAPNVQANPEPQPQLVGWTDDMGAPIEFEGEPEEDEHGYFVTQTVETLDEEALELLPVSYKDIRHTPYARHWDEVTEIAFRSSLDKRTIEERFGEEVADKLSFTAKKSDDKKPEENVDLPEKFIDVWEIWDKTEKKLLWLVENHDEFLDEKDDPYGLPGFYPCPPFILGTIGPDNLYPTPDFIQLRPFIKQLHALADRFRRLVRSNKVRGVFDASVTELSDLNLATPADGDYIGINNFAGQIVGKGGLDQVIQHFPNEKLVDATNQMQEVIKNYQELFNELYGIPDIVRGVSDPNETAAAQQEKGKWLSLRFSSVQREFQRLVRDDLELMVDLAVTKFEDQKLFEIMGFESRPPEEQQAFPQVLALLRDFDNRKIRVDIETDSTITFNEDADVAQRTQLAQTITESITAINQAANGDIDVKIIGYTALLFVVRGMRNGKLIADDLQQLVNKLRDQSKQPPAPPPPDPAVQKAQAQIQIQQQKGQVQMQVAQQKAQSDMAIQQQKAQTEMQIEQEEAAAEQQIEQGQAQHDVLVMHLRAQIDQLKAQEAARIEQLKAQGEMQLEAAKTKAQIINDEMDARKPEAPEAPHTIMIGGAHTL